MNIRFFEIPNSLTSRIFSLQLVFHPPYNKATIIGLLAGVTIVGAGSMYFVSSNPLAPTVNSEKSLTLSLELFLLNRDMPINNTSKDTGSKRLITEVSRLTLAFYRRWSQLP